MFMFVYCIWRSMYVYTCIKIRSIILCTCVCVQVYIDVCVYTCLCICKYICTLLCVRTTYLQEQVRTHRVIGTSFRSGISLLRDQLIIL